MKKKIEPQEQNEKNTVEENSVIPPVVIKRNNLGLLNHIQYAFDENGYIDWRKMISKEDLVINRANFEKRGEPIPDSIENVQDKDLLILLSGIKKLVNIRGYTSVKYNTVSPSPDYVVTTCEITWIPNYETEYREVVFSAIGDAAPRNTNGFGQNYLGSISENRAFVRAVRNFLRIPVLGQDEIGESKDNKSSNESSSSSKRELYVLELQRLMEGKNVTFDTLKNKLIKEGLKVEDATSIVDFETPVLLNLIERLNKKKS